MFSRSSAFYFCVLSTSLLGSSCLYTGGINHAPQFEEAIEIDETNLVLRGETTLTAKADDEDGDTLMYRWYVTIRPLGGDEQLALRDTKGTLVNPELRPVINTTESLTMLLPRRGTYDVEVEVVDPQGARSSARTSFEVKSQPPKPSLRLVVDTDVETNGGSSYPAHAWYAVTAADSSDPDDDLSCGSGAKIGFELRSPAGKNNELFDHWSVLPCEDGEVLDKLLLRGHPVSEPTKVVIGATITDPYGAASTAELPIVLQPNRPPCIRHTDPSFDTSRKVVIVSYTYPEQGGQTAASPVGRRFDVTHVSDDVPEYRFRWLVSDSEAGPYRPLAQQPGATLFLEASQGRPDQALYLRVVVSDSEQQQPDCPEGARTCAADPLLPDACYQWVTWEVAFR